MSAEVPLFLDVAVSLPGVSFAKVRRYMLSHGLNTLPEMTLEVFGTDANVDMAELLGQEAIVDLHEPALPRFEGIVRHVEQRSLDAAGVSIFALTVVPRPWLLTQRSGHRIFQDKDALQIANELLADYGAAMDRPQAVVLQRVLPRYEYRVQCGESDHDFLARILAEDGLVSLWTTDGKGVRAWIITDDTSTGSADMEVPYRPASGALAEAGPHVSSADVHSRLCPSEIRLRDYDYRKPKFLLEQRCISGDAPEIESPLARYTFAVGRFEEPPLGETLAARRLEEARAKSRSYRWEASFAMRPGMRIRLHDHPRDDANGDFVVVETWSEVDATARRHVAQVVPAEFPWRPALLPKPRIHGTQTAFVAGEAGAEIDVDSEGRIAVHFHWDTRNEGVSRRVRVAMPWAGPNRGFWTLPRAGDEVVIAYLDGDPDQPLVVGSVNNAVAPPAMPLPMTRTQSWWKSQSSPEGDGYNAILMEDAKDAEVLATYAQRDRFSRTGRRSQTTVLENMIVEVAGSQTVKVGGGQTTGSGSVSTTAAAGYSVKAKTLDLTSTADMHLDCGGTRLDSTLNNHVVVAADLTLTGMSCATLSGAAVRVTATGDGGNIEIEAPASIVLKVGSSSITLVDGKITIASPLIELNP